MLPSLYLSEPVSFAWLALSSSAISWASLRSANAWSSSLDPCYLWVLRYLVFDGSISRASKQLSLPPCQFDTFSVQVPIFSLQLKAIGCSFDLSAFSITAFESSTCLKTFVYFLMAISQFWDLKKVFPVFFKSYLINGILLHFLNLHLHPWGHLDDCCQDCLLELFPQLSPSCSSPHSAIMHNLAIFSPFTSTFSRTRDASILFSLFSQISCFQSKWGVGSVVMKNWEPFILQPAFVRLSKPSWSCLQ